MNITETDRLILRVFQPADLDDLTRIESDPEVMRLYATGPRTREQCTETIARWIEQQEKDGYGLWATVRKSDGRVIGSCGILRQWFDNVEDKEVAYKIASDVWGQGYATEAARAIRDWAFANLDVSRLISIIHPDNAASMRVADKNGMHYSHDADFRGQMCRIYVIEHP